MNELALFAGAGGGILGGTLLGWRTVCAVEIDPYAASVLAARQNDGILHPFPIWDDIRTFDGRPWRGRVDVVSGGFPCQDISAAGKGEGIDGERSGLWREMARIIHEVRPHFVFVENSPILTSRGLGRVLGDLAAMGFDAEWGVLAAEDMGAPHKRERIWIMGYSCSIGRNEGGHHHAKHEWPISATNGEYAFEMAYSKSQRCREAGQFRHNKRPERSTCCREDVADTSCIGLEGELGELQGRRETKDESSKGSQGFPDSYSKRLSDRLWGNGSRETENGTPSGEAFEGPSFSWWTTEPDVGRVAHGVAARVDRLKAIGNGQVPQCHAEAWQRLMKRFQRV